MEQTTETIQTSTSTELVPVTVANNLPSVIVCLSPMTLQEAQTLTRAATDMKVESDHALTVSNGIFSQVDKLAKKIAAGRLEITRPIDALKKSIIEAEEAATGPLLKAKAELGQRMITYRDAAEKAREEEERKVRAEAEEKARIERARLEAERQEIIRKQKEEAAEAEAMFGSDAPPPPPPPPPVAVVPVMEYIPAGTAIPKSAARTTTRRRIVVVDLDKVPVVLAGVRLLVLDEKAAEKLLKAGVEIPGLKLEEYSTIGSSGGRA